MIPKRQRSPNSEKVIEIVKKYQFIPTLFWIGLSLFVIFFSYRLGLEDKTGLEGVHNPGPGLMPFLLALALLLISLYLLIVPFLKKSPQGAAMKMVSEKGKTPNYGKMILVLACLLGYAFLLEHLGYLVTTYLALLLLFKGMGVKWGSALFASLTTTLVTYFLFTYLGLLFPEGIIKLQGVIR
jgi:putative tricarboxylic transport membrane protein